MGIPGSANPMLFGGAAAYQINQSLRFNSADSTYLNRTPASDTSSNKKGTFSCWMKIGSNSGTNGGTFIGAADTYHYGQFYNQSLYFGNASSYISTAALVRDHSAWYHIVFVFDTTLATANDRMIIYVNGSRQATGTYNTQPSQNSSFTFLNTAQAYNIGRRPSSPFRYFDGYLAEVNFIDGTALTPSSFGETDTITGAWIPKKYSGSYGTNGFYLKFESSGIGTDSSGNSNTWTANNFSTSGTGTDVMSDTPTNNYATINPLTNISGLSGTISTIADGNLYQNSAGNTALPTTIAIPAGVGKWYWEITINSQTGTSEWHIGIQRADVNRANYTVWSEVSGNSILVNTNASNTTYIYGASSTTTAWSVATNDVIGIAFDATNGNVSYYKNGTLQVTLSAAGNTSYPHYPAAFGYYTSSYFTWNFGQRAFAYTPPTGYKALNTANLPEPTIKDGSDYFNTVLYTGIGGAGQSITGVGFQPDLVWIKDRNVGYDHVLQDAVRGTGEDKKLYSSRTGGEADAYRVYGNVSSFDTNGFTVANGSSGDQHVNQNTYPYVAWNWKEGATQGFDIVSCATNGSGIITSTNHALGVAPSMIILKARTGTDSWYVYHKDSTTTATQGTLLLNTTAAVNTTNGTSGGVDKWTVSSTSFAAGNAAWYYQTNTNHIAYLFSEVAGYSKFGSYVSNNSADGPFIFCGFKPALVWLKKTSASSNWFMYDAARNTYNVVGNKLYADSSAAENGEDGGSTTSNTIDILSNGFKLRTNNGTNNGGDYIFCAWATHPFKYSNAR